MREISVMQRKRSEGKGGGFLGKPSFMPCFQSKVSRGEFTQRSRIETEQEREEWKEGRETTANRLRGEKIEKERQTAFLLRGKESHCEDQMTANTGRVRGWNRRFHNVSLRLETSAQGECQSPQDCWEGLQAVMHSDDEAGRRGEVRRASSQGAGHRTVKRTQLVFCCHGSTEGERFLSIRQSYHRYVPTPKTRLTCLPCGRIWILCWLKGKYKFLFALDCWLRFYEYC